MNFEEFNQAVKAMAPEGKASSVSFDILNSSAGGVYPTVKAYISEVGWTGCHESYEAALVELSAKVKGFDAPKIAEGGYPELAAVFTDALRDKKGE